MKDSAKLSLSNFFGDDERLLEDLIEISTTKKFQAGQTILKNEDGGTDLFYVQQGKAKAVLYSQEGLEIWIDEFAPYTIFGEMAILSNSPRTADIVADTNCQVCIINGSKFLDLMNEHAGLSVSIAKLLAERVRETTRKMFEMGAFSAKGRIINELLRLGEQQSDGTVLIKPVPILTKIAKRINTTRETVSRTVSELELHGYLKRSRGMLTIVIPNELME